MATQYARIEPPLARFIFRQKIFFTATATADSRINLHPRSTDALRVLDEARVCYLDLTGSGSETSAHLLADGRMTIMLCAFEGPPMILRYACNPLGLLLALRRLARIQHAVHAFPAAGLPSLRARLRHEIEGPRVPEPLREAALAALARLPEGDRLCHGDLHPAT